MIINTYINQAKSYSSGIKFLCRRESLEFLSPGVLSLSVVCVHRACQRYKVAKYVVFLCFQN